jgi:ATP-dependent DNA ligase
VLPRVQPIAPIRSTEPFDDPEWLFDFKHDGFRGLCYLEQGSCRLTSRNGNPMSRFTGLGDQIAASLDVGNAILDGEVIAIDETGRPQFYDLLRHTRALAYVAFDVLWLNDTDLRPLPLTARRRHLRNILPKGSAIISEALSVRYHAAEKFVATEAEAAAIRTTFEQRVELVAAVEVRRLFPGITDTAQARECTRTIAGWSPLPRRLCPVTP